MSKYNSFYEVLHGDESIPHTSHFIDNFSGDQLGDWWTQNDSGGAGTYAIVDAIDEGFSITTPATANNSSHIDFNLKRQFDHQNSIFIASVKMIQTTNLQFQCGLSNITNTYSAPTDISTFNANNAASNFDLLTSDNIGGTVIESTIAKDTNWHNIKIENNITNSILHIANTLEVTKTTDLPTAKLNPHFGGSPTEAVAKEYRIRYMECYNK